MSIIFNMKKYVLETEGKCSFFYKSADVCVCVPVFGILAKWTCKMFSVPAGMLKIGCNSYIHAQSICTYYSCFENMSRFVSLKKIKSKIWVAKSRLQKKQGQKEKWQPDLFSF